MPIRHLLALACAALLLGCATSTPIQRYSESKSTFSSGSVLMGNKYPGQDVYRVSAQGATFTSISGLRAEVENRAYKFCERQGKGMTVLGEKISQPPYILGNFPRIEIVFAVVAKGAP
jgi:hypothetical protein